ncbi:MAG: transposase [Anaerolineales bacterium]|nr:transposase [Anaerolineales bacterium]
MVDSEALLRVISASRTCGVHNEQKMTDIYKPHLHTPPHWFVSNAIYIVTGSVIDKKPLLDSDAKLGHFCETLIERSKILNWSLEAWAVMSNHYHFIARSPEDALSLKSLIQGVHSISAKFVNAKDAQPGRKVWHNYWDTCIRTEKSYYARMNYVMMNPVKHGLVEKPEEYPFSSYRYFIENTQRDFRQTVLSCKDDAEIEDNY